MSYCPISLKPCIDDLCLGAGCVRGGGTVWERCECGALFDPEEGSVCEDCERDLDEGGIR